MASLQIDAAFCLARAHFVNVLRGHHRDNQRLDCLILLWEHRLDAGSFKSFPAPTVRFDFNHYYGES
jgi:hypothetical protein